MGGFGPGFGGGFGTGFARSEGGGGDTTPDGFIIAHRTGMPVSTVIQSAPFTITGIDASSTWSIVGGTLSINGGAFSGAGGTVENEDELIVKVTSSPDPGTGVSATLTVGGVEGIFLVTTAAETDIDVFPRKGGGVRPPKGASHATWGAYLARQKNRARRRQAQG